jgi:hypothetical protein
VLEGLPDRDPQLPDRNKLYSFDDYNDDDDDDDDNDRFTVYTNI